MKETKETIEALVLAKLQENIQQGGYYPDWIGDEEKVAEEVAAAIIAEVIAEKDDLIHNLSLDLARLQGCHVEDKEYRGHHKSTIFR